MPNQTNSVTALRVALLAVALALPETAQAQLAPARLQLALPPSTWRLTLTADALPSRVVKRQAGGPIDSTATDAGRLSLRLGAPVWKRGLYRTVIANEFSVDRISLGYDQLTPPPLVGDFQRGPAQLTSVQHDLLISQGIGTRWRVSGVLQHGFFTDAGTSFTRASYRAAGGAFVSRVYRPTFQLGAGLLTLNVAPWVIPTIRIIHVGQRWRSDILLPRAESWYDMGHGVELGGTLRFLANRWNSDDSRELLFSSRSTTTYRQATFGPAVNWKVAKRAVLQVESGTALRQLRSEITRCCTSNGTPGSVRPDVQFDNPLAPFFRASGRVTF